MKNGFIITCAGRLLGLHEGDRLLYVYSNPRDEIYVFPSRYEARKAIYRNIRNRKKMGYFDHFAATHCYIIHPLKGQQNEH